MNNLYSMIDRDIAALIPCYHKDMGNATEIVSLNAEPVIVPRTVKTVLKNLARLHAVDLKASKEKYGGILGCKRAVPVVISSAIIFMTLKMRKVFSRNDAIRGYINYFAISDVKEGEDTCSSLLVLKNSREIVCFHSIKNLNQHVRNCHYLHQKIIKSSGESDKFSDEYLNSLATKGDIALMLKELRELKDKL